MEINKLAELMNAKKILYIKDTTCKVCISGLGYTHNKLSCHILFIDDNICKQALESCLVITTTMTPEAVYSYSHVIVDNKNRRIVSGEIYAEKLCEAPYGTKAGKILYHET